MFRAIRDLASAIIGLSEVGRTVGEVVKRGLVTLDYSGPLEARLEALERDRLVWEARVESDMLRAEGQFKSARGSEERARTFVKHAEALNGSDEGESEVAIAAISQLLSGDEPGGTPVEVPAVPENLVVDPKAHARMAKWGVS